MRVALDLDGTLITCGTRQCAVVQAVVRQWGLPKVDLNLHWRWKRSGLNTVEALVKEGMPEATAQRIGDAWVSEIERWAWLRLDCVFPGIPELLDRLLDRGHTLAIVTARRHGRFARLQAEQLGLLKRVERFFVVDPSRAVKAKANFLSDFDADCFVGDTESDAKAAARAKIRFAAVTTGQRSGKFLRAQGVKTVHENLAATLDACVERQKNTQSIRMPTPEQAPRRMIGQRRVIKWKW
jgi:phosphoglycolate phosphatase-like HAD superfamily hydrolase